jgi:hypothetical protein
MERTVDITFDSEKITGSQKYQLASGYISQTSILFEKEGVIAVIQANGTVEFFDRNDSRIAAGNAPAIDDGRGVYEDVFCAVNNGAICLEFPVYKWIDNYPTATASMTAGIL